MKKFSFLFLLLLVFAGCKEETKDKAVAETKKPAPKPIVKEFGFVLDDFDVVIDTIERGDNFGYIL